jgi:hypothetical protein
METIEFDLGKVKLSIDDFSLHNIEEQAVIARQEVYQRIFRGVLAHIENKIDKNIKCGCGLSYIKNGKEPRHIMTSGGKISFVRRRMRCPACANEFYPLDEEIGLSPAQKHSLFATEKILDMATDNPYQRTSKTLKDLAFIEVSPQKISDLIADEGKRLLDADEGRRRAAFDEFAAFPEELTKKKLAVVQVDSTGINDRATGSWMDTKVGIIYSKVKKISKNRNLITDKHVYATLDNVEKFRERFYLSAHEMGVFRAELVLFVSDGATWIRNIQAEMFPGSIYLLDLWHLKHKILLAFGKNMRELADNLAELTGYGDASPILDTIKSELSRCRDPDRRSKLKDLLAYVISNTDGIENYGKYGIVGSGAVEKTTDVLVCRRFKLRGMSWYERNAANLLRLRLLKINGQWNDYWAKRKTEELSRKIDASLKIYPTVVAT